MKLTDHQVARAQVVAVVAEADRHDEFLRHDEIIERCKEMSLAETIMACDIARRIGVFGIVNAGGG
jgi:hypothetical protein